MQPPTVDFSSYDEGMRVLKYVLRRVTGTARFQNRRSTVTKQGPKDKKPAIPQRSTSDGEKAPQSFTEANQLPAARRPTTKRQYSSLLEAIEEGFHQMLQRGLGSTTDL